ncbi:hypothetical protein [Entomospira culicis]|uniref:Uncharacterized protein n=1 Tax=Entomospira culicis TaxID=2719989 RepID=A0A968GFB3_9SPIO|nr:hypothetical protein [Entomospira culicis]NIZ19022.1 hypothetical protein [Entomospira culicis]NIZ69237.1 hypothetical protein [Entomospira culicis]WDI37821.1 hypothetical protein PVA46_03280 [Entomospira culicis]WDI39449.1 hypothetical protein PVA47_03285 [Entomospira culicis]
MKRWIGWALLAMLLVSCQDKITQDSKPATMQMQTFTVDGFPFEMSVLATKQMLRERGFRFIYEEKITADQEIFLLIDSFATYEGKLFGQAVEAGFHFKDDRFKYVVFQIKQGDMPALVGELSVLYGKPFSRGEEFGEEVFQGDNLLWRVLHDGEEIGYISLMPIPGANNPDDWGASVTVFPYTAQPQG